MIMWAGLQILLYVGIPSLFFNFQVSKQIFAKSWQMFAKNLCKISTRIKLIIFEISHFDKGAKLIEFRPKKNGQNMLQMDKKGQKAAPIPLKVPFILDLNELGS